MLLTYIQSDKYQLQLNVRLYFKTKLFKYLNSLRSELTDKKIKHMRTKSGQN
jgi:hypothetical protein